MMKIYIISLMVFFVFGVIIGKYFLSHSNDDSERPFESPQTIAQGGSGESAGEETEQIPKGAIRKDALAVSKGQSSFAAQEEIPSELISKDEASSSQGNATSSDETLPSENIPDDGSSWDNKDTTISEGAVSDSKNIQLYFRNPRRIHTIYGKDLKSLSPDFHISERINGTYEGRSKIFFEGKTWRDDVSLNLNLRLTKGGKIWGTFHLTVAYRSNQQKGQTVLKLGGNTLRGRYLKQVDMALIEFETSGLKWFHQGWSRLQIAFPVLEKRKGLQLFRYNKTFDAYDKVGDLIR